MHFHNFVLLTGFRVAFAVNLEETDAPTRGHALSLTCYSGSCANSDHGKATPSAREVQEAAAFLESQVPTAEGDDDPNFSPEVGPAPQGSNLMGWVPVNHSAEVVDVFKPEDRVVPPSKYSAPSAKGAPATASAMEHMGWLKVNPFAPVIDVFKTHLHHHYDFGRIEDLVDRPCSDDVITGVFFNNCERFNRWPQNCGEDCAKNRNADGAAQVSLVMSDLTTSCRHICEVCCRPAGSTGGPAARPPS